MENSNSFFTNLISMVVDTAQRAGAFGIFIAAFVEEIIAPIPSSLILLASGFFLLPRGHDLFSILPDALVLIVLPATLGLTLGSFVVYGIAYFGGRPFIMRFGRWVGVSWEQVNTFREKFTKGSADELVIFMLRVVPVVPNVLISLGCGAIRYPVKSFFVTSVFGNAFRALLMALIGWSAGSAYASYANQISIAKQIVIGTVCVVIVFFVLRIFRKKWL